MKTAISIPDADFERFEQVAARLGVSRSEFYRMAARQMVDELDDKAELTAMANAVIERHGQPSDDLFLDAAQRAILDTDW